MYRRESCIYNYIDVKTYFMPYIRGYVIVLHSDYRYVTIPTSQIDCVFVIPILASMKTIINLIIVTQLTKNQNY